MRALIQRVTEGGVSSDRGENRIGPGLVILLGVAAADTRNDSDYLVEKVTRLRIFNDDGGKMNKSLLDVGGEALVISQFTLYADTRRGRRPGFTDAAPPETAAPLYEAFADAVQEAGVNVKRGWFGANMQVDIQNDGPVTILLESPAKEAT